MQMEKGFCLTVYRPKGNGQSSTVNIIEYSSILQMAESKVENVKWEVKEKVGSEA